jgi:hypothetical protein
VVRIDSAYYSAAVLGALRRGGACFSVTVPMRRDVRAAIEAIPDSAWTPITYPRAIWDENQKRLIADAQVAEVPYTAFATKRKGQAITRPADRIAEWAGHSAEVLLRVYAKWLKASTTSPSAGSPPPRDQELSWAQIGELLGATAATAVRRHRNKS